MSLNASLVPIYHRVKITKILDEDNEVIFNEVTPLDPNQIDSIKATIQGTFPPESYTVDVYPA